MRGFVSFPHDIVNIREFPVRLIDGNLKIRFIIDRYSMEMFVNDGEQAASFVLYAPENAESISFYCEGSSVIDIEKYDLPGKIPVIPSLAEPLALKYGSPPRPVQDISPDTEKEKSID